MPRASVAASCDFAERCRQLQWRLIFEAVYPLKEEPKALPKTRQCSYGNPYSLSHSLSLTVCTAGTRDQNIQMR